MSDKKKNEANVNNEQKNDSIVLISSNDVVSEVVNKETGEISRMSNNDFVPIKNQLHFMNRFKNQIAKKEVSKVFNSTGYWSPKKVYDIFNVIDEVKVPDGKGGEKIVKNTTNTLKDADIENMPFDI